MLVRSSSQLLDHAGAPPQLGDVGQVELVAQLGRKRGRPRVAQDVEPLGVRLHEAVLDAVVDHLDEVAGADRPAVEVALVGGALAVAARGGRDLAAPRRQRAQHRFDTVDRLLRPAHHQAIAALRAPDAAAGPGIDVMDAAPAGVARAAHVVLEVRVSAVDDRVARLERLGQRCHRLLGGGAGGHHHPDRARRGQSLDELVEAAGGDGALRAQRGHRVRVAIMHHHLVAALHQAPGHVRTHPAETDHSDLHRGLPPQRAIAARRFSTVCSSDSNERANEATPSSSSFCVTFAMSTPARARSAITARAWSRPSVRRGSGRP